MEKTILKTTRNTYFINFPINAHCEAEAMLGFPVTQLNEHTTGITAFRSLLFVGLKYGGNHVTLEQAGDIMGEVIQDQGMEYFSKQIGEAINKGLQKQNSQNFKNQHNKKKY